ncbi:uncharacterized protein IUM83_13076 [Phytophthora cinnamomi]|uniref:uncharacterized protein n=1 Tax=Phytophthora cinnamomi TaxID=4785 RepID=UPI003559EAB9|nr:hypothetical protein IUM83_13076 [Phytophthora cinnamomi]
MSRDHRDKERKDSRKTSSSSSRRSSRRDDEGRSSRPKSHKSSRHHEKEQKLPKGAKQVAEEDYFLRQTEFRVWLAQSKGKYVDDLSTEEATELFTDEFARKWNRGKLAKMFYEGLPESIVEQTKRTRHRWEFVAKLGEKEKFELATAKDSVGVATRKENLLSSGRSRESEKSRFEETSENKRDRRQEKEDEDNRDEDRKRRKVERKREREYRDAVMEELAPKATGREAQIEKRRQLGVKLHGAARDREDARDGLDLSDDFLMGCGRGGGDDDLKRRMAQRDSVRRRKQDEQQEKLAELKAKEAARMDTFLSDMGLAGPNANGGKPMLIPPRR